MKHKVFLRWLLFVVLIANGLLSVHLLGLLGPLFSTSTGTFIGSLIAGMLCISTIKLGQDSFALTDVSYIDIDLAKMEQTAEPGDSNLQRDLAALQNNTNVSKFIASLCTGFGFLGTVIGIIIMFGGFAVLDPGNMESVMTLMEVVSAGFATAFYTTLVGLAAAICIAIQCKNIDYEIQHIRDLITYGR